MYLKTYLGFLLYFIIFDELTSIAVGDGALDVPKEYILTESKNVGDGALDVPNGLFD